MPREYIFQCGDCGKQVRAVSKPCVCGSWFHVLVPQDEIPSPEQRDLPLIAMLVCVGLVAVSYGLAWLVVQCVQLFTN